MLKTALRKLIPVASKLVSTELVQRSLGRFIPIFMLHRMEHPDYGINGQSVDTIRHHLEYFRRNGYHAISLQQLGEHLRDGVPIPFKSAVFTIDDGFIDHHDIAGPLFSEFDIPLTYFLVSDFIDGELWPWDDQISYAIENAATGDYRFESSEISLNTSDDRRAAIEQIRQRFKAEDNSELYRRVTGLFEALAVEPPSQIPQQHSAMSWQQANSLVTEGHCIAAHTRSHRILSRLNDADARDEISHSIDRVNTMVKGASRVFAYPTGRSDDFTPREAGVLQDNEIITTVSTVSAPYIYNSDVSDEIHRLPRLAMPSSHDDFIQYLGWIEFLKHKLRHH